MPLDELSSRRTDYATGARLGPLFGRKGAVITRGNNHALKVAYPRNDDRAVRTRLEYRFVARMM